MRDPRRDPRASDRLRDDAGSVWTVRRRSGPLVYWRAVYYDGEHDEGVSHLSVWRAGMEGVEVLHG